MRAVEYAVEDGLVYSFCYLALNSKLQSDSMSVRNIFGMQESQLQSYAHPMFRLRGVSPGCRRCGAPSETPQHVVAGCIQYRATLMLERHNQVARNFFYWACRKFEATHVHHTQEVPVESIGLDGTVIWWDRYVATPVKLRHYRPDMIIYRKWTREIFVIEVGVSWFTRLDDQYSMKYQKYAVNSTLLDTDSLPYPPGPSLALELQKMYGCVVRVLPFVIGCGGEVTEKYRETLNLLPGVTTKEVEDLLVRTQRSAILSTDRIIKAHLS
ncbi:unnamed protein product [Caenorhabditis auriculariae]|uniref:Uncharacterized protein n=1 Tax=Caenorhabditis auriculariae TaxID=2777116 RepID=A0A8S1H8D4_9PELO|nr:unnamed protein product [Caenorhabditis auriculariae]